MLQIFAIVSRGRTNSFLYISIAFHKIKGIHYAEIKILIFFIFFFYSPNPHSV